jgi:hypothetical protein
MSMISKMAGLYTFLVYMLNVVVGGLLLGAFYTESYFKSPKMTLISSIILITVGMFSLYSLGRDSDKKWQTRYLNWFDLDIKNDYHLFFLNSLFLLIFVIITFVVLEVF